MIFNTYRSRVKRGIKFLDKHVGRGVWLERVNADHIDVQCDVSCPLAQATEESYWNATYRLGLGTDGLAATRTAWLGFLDAPRDFSDGLTSEWRRQVRALQLASDRARVRLMEEVG